MNILGFGIFWLVLGWCCGVLDNRFPKVGNGGSVEWSDWDTCVFCSLLQRCSCTCGDFSSLFDTSALCCCVVVFLHFFLDIPHALNFLNCRFPKLKHICLTSISKHVSVVSYTDELCDEVLVQNGGIEYSSLDCLNLSSHFFSILERFEYTQPLSKYLNLSNMPKWCPSTKNFPV